MKPVQAIDLAAADALDLIKFLHEALPVIWNNGEHSITEPAGQDKTDFVQEVQAATAAAKYGKVTKKLVAEFRQKKKLGDGSQSDTDAPTAQAMNTVLLVEGKVWRIHGSVAIDAEGKQGVPGVRVRACEFQGSSEPELGEAVYSEVAGAYAIWLEKPAKTEALNVFAKAFGQNLDGKVIEIGRTATEWGGLGDNLNDLDLKVVKIKEGAAGPIEFTELRAKVASKLGSLGLPKTIQEITSDQIERILLPQPELKGFSHASVEQLVLAHLFEDDAAADAALPAPFFYAFLRTDSLLYVVWQIRQGEKPDTQFAPDAQTGIALKPPPPLPPLEGASDEAKNARKKHLAQIAFYSTVKDEENDEAQVADVMRAAVFGRFVEYDCYQQAVAKNYSAKLRTLRKNLEKQKPAGISIGFYELVTGDFMVCQPATAADDPDPILKDLADKAALPAPYDAVVTSILKSQTDKTAPFPGFRIMTGNAYAKWEGVNAGALLGLQRVVKLTRDSDEVKYLLGAGLDSAWKIRMRGQSRFVKDYVAAFSGTSASPEELAKKALALYNAATSAAEATAHMYAEAKSLATAQQVNALCKDTDRAHLQTLFKESRKGAASGLPSWERLFGSLDACACEQCQSIHGPASYLVDVLQYFKRLEPGEPAACKDDAPARPCLCGPKGTKFNDVFEVLMSRRPDIGYLDLNCANAMTPVPYIDLVCELLEDFLPEKPVEIQANLDAGKLPGTILKELQTAGFLEVTAKAMVTVDSKDNRLVRDTRILLLFERKYDDKGQPVSAGGCPVWLVKQLRQTYGTEQEVGAATEYMNKLAYDTLAGSHLCLSLPFDANRIEATAYLDRMETDRATAMRRLAKWPEISGNPPANALKVATEVLNLTKVERELITRPDPAQQHEYWAEEAATVVAEVSQLHAFLEKTGLKTEPVDRSELDELLAGKFINPGGDTIKIVSDDAANPGSDCDTMHLFLKRQNPATGDWSLPLEKSDLDRIHRFLRLWRKLAWPINLLDRLIMSSAVGKGNLDDVCLQALAEIVGLAGEWGMDPVKAAAWFADLSTYGERPDYRIIFLQKTDDGHPYQPFLPENLSPPGAQGAPQPTETIEARLDAIAKALGVPSDQVQEWLTYCGLEPGEAFKARLSLRNLSRLWAWFRFAKKLGLTMSDLVRVLALLGQKDALERPSAARVVWEAVKLMKRHGLKIADLRYWLRHKPETEVKLRLIPDLAVAKILDEIRKAFTVITESRPAKEIAIYQPAQRDRAEVYGDGQATCTEKLGAALASVPDFKPEDALAFINLLLNRKSPADVTAFQALLTAAPLKDIPEVAASATQAPVNTEGAWDEEADLPKHREYQQWAAALLSKLLNYLDARGREDAVIGSISKQTGVPLEQMDVILRCGRMPTATGPATGISPLALLMNEEWTRVPVIPGQSEDDQKLCRALWEAVFLSKEEDVAKLQDNPRKFRDAVLAAKPLVAWAPPPDEATAQKWRGSLTVCFLAVRLAHKIAALAKALKLDTKEHLAWGMKLESPGGPNRFQALGWFSPDEVPVVASTSEVASEYPRWVFLLEGLEFLNDYPLISTENDPNLQQGGATVLELALKAGPPATAKGYDVDTVRDILTIDYMLFGSADQDMVALANWIEIPRAAFRLGKTHTRLKEAGELLLRLGIPFASLAAMTDEAVMRDLVLTLRQALKHQSDGDTWLDTLKEIQDPLREQKRDALVAYLIANPKHGCFQDVDDLYDHLLIDTQMCACMPTSRIVQAHAVVQLFAQRCQMGQEPAVDPRADRGADGTGNDWNEWAWMRNYRVWEANRKVFLYPENWIEPELRDDKSQFFKEFEQTLLQTEVNDNNVETAARDYLNKLDDAAFLEVMAVHYQDEGFSENGKLEGRVLHVVARTKGGDPAVYFYRRFVKESYWTPWEKIDLDIVTDHILLFIRNSRLNIAWPVFTDTVDEDAQLDVPKMGESNQEVPKYPRGWTIQLAMSERSNGRWLPKRTSKEGIQTPMVTATADRMDAEKKRCRFFILDKEPRDYLLVPKDEFRNGFFITGYGFLANDDKRVILPLGVQTEPTLLGAFNLAGCKGIPEKVTNNDQLKFLASAGGPTTIPRIRDAELETQRWKEHAGDADNDLVIEGLMANNLAPTSVFGATPGTFKVTIAQQNTLLDRSIVDALKLLGQEPTRWKPGGVMTPFFYEDGRRGYVAVPTIRTPELGEITINDLLADFAFLYPSLAAAANRENIQSASGTAIAQNWKELIKQWLESPDKNIHDAFDRLKKHLNGCFGLKFLPFYHPFVCLMKRELAAAGFEGLMKLSPGDPRQPNAQVDEFNKFFEPKAVVLPPYPKETAGFAFDRRDSYASYNWEVFYHLPTLVSQKMTTGQKFEDAMRWFHFVFNPKGATDNVPPPGRFWVTKPFQQRSDATNPFDTETYVGQRIETILDLLDDPNDGEVSRHWQDEVTGWRKTPFVPFQVARGRTVAFQKATVMRYMDSLIQWGDFLFRQDTRESVNEALQLYITAERLLGARPRLLKRPNPAPTRTYRELEVIMWGEDQGFDTFGNSLVELENVLPPQKGVSTCCTPCMPSLPAGTLLTEPYFCIPRNEKLMGYWDTVADRLYKIRHCQNIEGIERQLALFAPPIDPGLLVRAIAAGLSIGDVLAQGAGQTPLYRFQVLAQKATELIQMVISLGNGLLQAIEKKDAEALARLRSSHEINLLKFVKDIKMKQVQEAQQSLLGLQRTKATTTERRNFYRDIKYTIKSEERALDLNEDGTGLETASLALNTAANIFHLIPDFDFGGSGFGGSPVAKVRWGGQNLGLAASAMGQFLGGLGSLKRAAAGAVGTRAGYERRWEEWKLQERLADRELLQIERQIAAAEIRVDITKDELRNHEKQIEQAEEVLAFMKDRKFTNQELYEWMIGQISANYFQAWQLAHRFTLRVERAYHFELGPKNDHVEFDQYVRPDSWDNLHKGLLAGEKLLFDLKRMEVDYLDRNRRDFEITKHISLVRLDPWEFLKLKKEGKCQIELPDWLFDMDYPGHYFRRIKSVSLSIPCVVGPYSNVNCTLTLIKSTIRIKAKQDEGEDDEDNILRNFSRVQSIATSGAQNDSGLFEVNFRDERYLPFEGAGAESSWTLELDQKDNRQLDFDSVTDVILHLKYTSRFGGGGFQKLRRGVIDGFWKNGAPTPKNPDLEIPMVQRLFFLKDEFPSEWHRFNDGTGTGPRKLTLKGVMGRMPYFSPNLHETAFRVKLIPLRKGDLLPNTVTLNGLPPSDNGWSEVPLTADSVWEIAYPSGDRPPELAMLVEANLGT